MEFITRTEALEQGLKLYYTGVPCKHGHDCERYTKNYGCVECCKIHNKKPPTGKKPGRQRILTDEERILHRRESRRKHKQKQRERMAADPEYREEVLKKIREQKRFRYNNDPEYKKKTLDGFKVRYAKNPEKYRQIQKDLRKKDPELYRKKKRDEYHALPPDKKQRAINNSRVWAKQNPEKVKAYSRKNEKRYAKQLTDSYVRRLLRQHNQLDAADIPQPLVEVKREEIKLKRLLKEIEDANTTKEPCPNS